MPRITDLTALPAGDIAAGDVIPIVDVAPAATTKKVDVSGLLRGLLTAANRQIDDANGNALVAFGGPIANAVNHVSITNSTTGNAPTIESAGADANVSLRLSAKGTGNVVALTGLHCGSTRGLGYTAGAGGTVTQTTSKSTAVTLNRPCGTIVTHNAALAANTTVSFVVNNNTITSTDVVVINHASGGTLGAYQVWATSIGAGVFTVRVRNISGSSLSEALTLNFAILKSVTV